MSKTAGRLTQFQSSFGENNTTWISYWCLVLTFSSCLLVSFESKTKYILRNLRYTYSEKSSPFDSTIKASSIPLVWQHIINSWQHLSNKTSQLLKNGNISFSFYKASSFYKQHSSILRRYIKSLCVCVYSCSSCIHRLQPPLQDANITFLLQKEPWHG